VKEIGIEEIWVRRMIEKVLLEIEIGEMKDW